MPKKTSDYLAALKAVAWLSLTTLSPSTFAIELGLASVHSPLESPLSASLPLLDSSAYPLDELQMQVADEDAFSAAGLEWMPSIQAVNATLEEREGSRHVVLSSQQPVTTPWLDLLLTLDSPEGPQTHAVTLLFDPAGYSSITSSLEAQDSAVTTLDVLPGDTLWRIAERSKPNEVSIQQMMLALVEANPDLFPAGNINSLRAGQTLTVPSADQALSRSPSDAAQTVRAMVDEGQQSSTSAPLALSEVETQTETVGEGGLQNEPLIAASPEGTISNAANSSEEETEQSNAIAELGMQLAESQTSLLEARQEREQLRAELDDLRHSLNVLKEDMAAVQAASSSSQASNAGVATLPALDRNTQTTGSLLARLERSQWSPIHWVLGVLLIGLLVIGLWWFLKRRKVPPYDRKQYGEGATLTEPEVFRPTDVASEKTASPSFLNIPLSYRANKRNAHIGGETTHHEQDTLFSANVAKCQAAGLVVPRAAEPLQPSVTFTSGAAMAPLVDKPEKASFDPSSSDAQWEIEEVAFEPRGRDNS